ncbi:MAG: hypothetical protein WC889_13995, partial [Myxococcota bacterium]
MRNYGDVLAGISLGSLAWAGVIAGALLINNSDLSAHDQNTMKFGAFGFGMLSLGVSIFTGLPAIGLLAAASAAEKSMPADTGRTDSKEEPIVDETSSWYSRPGNSYKVAAIVVTGLGL